MSFFLGFTFRVVVTFLFGVKCLPITRRYKRTQIKWWLGCFQGNNFGSFTEYLVSAPVKRWGVIGTPPVKKGVGFECFLSSWVALFCCLFLSFFWIPRTNFGRGKWCRFSLLVPWRSGRWLSFRADFWGTPSKVRAVFCERIVGLSGGFVVCFC